MPKRSRHRDPEKAQIAVEWPTSEEVARIIVAACAPEQLDPIGVADGTVNAPRARAYAFVAMGFRFPSVNRSAIARLCGDRRRCIVTSIVARGALVRGTAGWFDLDRLNSICVALGWPAMTAEDARNATSGAWASAEAARRTEAADLPPPAETAASGSLMASDAVSGAADEEEAAEARADVTTAAESDDDFVAVYAAGKFEPPPGAGAATLALKSNSCRWPFGDPSLPDFHFCGEPALPGSEPMYCGEHAKMHGAAPANRVAQRFLPATEKDSTRSI